MTKLISGRTEKIHSANVSAERYQFLTIAEAEPDLGLPTVAGQVFTSDLQGNRRWITLDQANFGSNAITIANLSVLNTYVTNITVTAITAQVWNQLYSSNVIESPTKLFYTNARVLSAVTPLLTTANVTELNNLYFTNARARTAVTGGTGVGVDWATGTIAIGQSVATNADVTFNSVTVNKNLTVYGNVTTYGANNMSVSDNMIYINAGAEQANPDIGFTFGYNDGTYHHGGFFRDATDGTFKVFNNYSPEPDANVFINTEHSSFRLANIQATKLLANFFIGGNIAVNQVEAQNIIGNVWTGIYTSNVIEWNTSLFYTNARVLSAVNPLLTTSNVVEGTNLYFTNARAILAITTNLTTANIAEAASNLYFTYARVNSFVQPYLTTANVVETTNQYFTNVRVLQAVNPKFTTANVTELTNLYFTNARVITVVTPTQTTANTVEVTNQYFTNVRAVQAVTSTTLANISLNDLLVNGNITLGSAVGGNITGVYSITADRIYANVIGNITGLVSSLDNLTTTNLKEGSNLYFTNARVVTVVTPLLTTANTVELTNQYFTNARVLQAVTPTQTTANTVELTNLYFTNTRVALSVLLSGLLTTANVTELSNNLYFTNNRAVNAVVNTTLSNITVTTVNTPGTITVNSIVANTISSSAVGTPTLSSATSINLNANGSAGGAVVVQNSALRFKAYTVAQRDALVAAQGDVIFNSNSSILQVYNGAGWVDVTPTLTTANVAEAASNLYFTCTRVVSTVTPLLTTANVTELTNLYFTNARVITVVTPTHTTANIIESSSNLYFTQARVTPLLTTANVIEVANASLFYTNSRVLSALAVSNVIVGNVVSLGDVVSYGNLVANGLIIRNIAVSDSVLIGNVSACSIVSGNIVVNAITSNIWYGLIAGAGNVASYGLSAGSGIQISANGRITSTSATVTGGTGIIVDGNGRISTNLVSSEFNQALNGTGYHNVTGDMVDALTFTGVSVDDRFILRSIHIVNLTNESAYLASNIYYYDQSNVYPYLSDFLIPASSAVELLPNKAQVHTPGDIIRMQAFNASRVASNNILQATFTYEAFNYDPSLFGKGYNLTANAETVIIDSSLTNTNTENIRVSNLSGNVIPVTIKWVNSTNVTKSYWAYNYSIPGKSVVEILAKPKFINRYDKVIASYNSEANNSISMFLSGRYSDSVSYSTLAYSTQPGANVAYTFTGLIALGYAANNVLYYTIEPA